MPSKTIEKFVEGSLVDRITGHMLFGDRVPLKEHEAKRLKEVEDTLALFDFHNGNQNLIIKALQNRPGEECSFSHAYQLVQDAKFVFPYLDNFNFLTELLLKKQRLEKAISKCFADNDMFSLPKMEAEHLKCIEAIERVYNRRKKPEKIVINLHMDMTRIGITQELYDEWKHELETEIIPSVKRKYKGYDIEDAEFTDITE
jgi:hypothetical protein